MRPLRSDLVRFGIVGSIGFIVDLGILTALVHAAGWNVYVARAASILTAVACTWWLHRRWTFASGRMRAPLPQSVMYGALQLSALAANYALFSLLLLTGEPWRSYPVLAAAVGSISVMGITYLLASRIAFAESGAMPRWTNIWKRSA